MTEYTFVFDMREGHIQYKGRTYRVVDKKTGNFLWWEAVQTTINLLTGEKTKSHFSVFNEDGTWVPGLEFLNASDMAKASVRKINYNSL